jgi:hypothetical protein
MFQEKREGWKRKMQEWLKIEIKTDSLRVQLLTGQAEKANKSLLLHLKTQVENPACVTICEHDVTNFHLGHYLVMCDSMLLFEKFQKYGGFSWSTPMLPIHLAMSIPNRTHWLPILAPLSGFNMNQWGMNGLNLATWAVAYHYSFAPLILFNMWPPDQTFATFLRVAQREENTSATTILKALCKPEE